MWLIWFLLKLAGAGVALVFGLVDKKFLGATQQTYRNTICHICLKKNKGKITGRSVGVDHKGPKFRLTRESSWDARFKTWGLSTEIQTGDQKFDDVVYVISDNPLLTTHLGLSQDTRDKVRAALSGEYTEVECDGERLWLTAKGDQDVSDLDMKRISELSLSMDKIKSEAVPMYREPFFYKAFLTEAFLYSLSGYAMVALLEQFVTHETLILHFSQQIWWGLALGVLLFALLLSVVRSLFRGSSRGHKIILESALLLAFSLPLVGIGLVEDINVGLDHGAPLTVDAKVVTMSRQEHKTKNGQYYTYHAELAPSPDAQIDLPAELSVSQGIFQTREGKSVLQLNLGQGALGLPWMKSLRWKE